MSNIAGSSVEIEQRHAGGDELRQRVLLERGDDAGAEVRERADVEDGAAAGELRDEAGVLDRADPVAQPVGAERLERAAHRRGAGDLAGVRHRAEAERARERERGRVRLRRELRLEPAEPDPDDAPVAVPRRVPHDLLAPARRVDAAVDVRRQPHLDAVQLARLLGAVAVAAEDLVPVDAARDALGRAEDRLEVDGAVRRPPRRRSRRPSGGSRRAVCSAFVVRIQTSMKWREVAEPVERLEVVGERVVVPLRDRAQRVGPHRPLEVDVQLDLRLRRSAGHRTQGTARMCECQ